MAIILDNSNSIEKFININCMCLSMANMIGDKKQSSRTIESRIYDGFLGCAFGFILGGVGCMLDGSCIDTVKVFEKDGKSAVMRVYANYGSDKILVETNPGSGNYCTLDKYLSWLSDFSDRDIERATSKKNVRCYEE